MHVKNPVSGEVRDLLRKRLDSKYVQLWELNDLCWNYLLFPLEWKSSQRQYIYNDHGYIWINAYIQKQKSARFGLQNTVYWPLPPFNCCGKRFVQSQKHTFNNSICIKIAFKTMLLLSLPLPLNPHKTIRWEYSALISFAWWE